MSDQNPYEPTIPPRIGDGSPPFGPHDSETRPPDAIESLIPYRNAPALLAYYTGLFSLLPLLGIPLMIVAWVAGYRGLALAKSNPNARGKAHAWVGILVALVSIPIQLCSSGLLIYGIISAIKGN